jgi:anhydro-N-acetylmuramic acid kinase
MWTIGLMSGTSLDGIDGVLMQWQGGLDSPTAPSNSQAELTYVGVAAAASTALSDEWRAEILALNARHGSDELHRAAVAGIALTQAYAEVVIQLLTQARLQRTDVRAIGAHGQTLRHQPKPPLVQGYTLQLMNGALLAELTGIDVVCDFRSRDVAAGGQGAPLAPLFHREFFRQVGRTVAVLNWGGIANLTVISAEPGVATLGFDCGPANMLLDAWCQRHTGQRFDDAGAWAQSGIIDNPLLQHLLQSEPFFAAAPPKSTGRDLFGLSWLNERLQSLPTTAPRRPQDVQATLVELTARSSADAVKAHGGRAEAVYVCGGGAHNAYMMQRLRAQWGAGGSPGKVPQIDSTATLGLPPTQVEAAAFAWLAAKHVRHEPLDATAITGAAGARLLGCCYPA